MLGRLACFSSFKPGEAQFLFTKNMQRPDRTANLTQTPSLESTIEFLIEAIDFANRGTRQ